MSSAYKRPNAASILEGKPVFGRQKKELLNVVENRLRRELIVQAGYAHPVPPPFAVDALHFEIVDNKTQFLGGSQDFHWKLTFKQTGCFIFSFSQTEGVHVVQKEVYEGLYSCETEKARPTGSMIVKLKSQFKHGHKAPFVGGSKRPVDKFFQADDHEFEALMMLPCNPERITLTKLPLQPTLHDDSEVELRRIRDPLWSHHGMTTRINNGMAPPPVFAAPLIYYRDRLNPGGDLCHTYAESNDKIDLSFIETRQPWW